MKESKDRISYSGRMKRQDFIQWKNEKTGFHTVVGVSWDFPLPSPFPESFEVYSTIAKIKFYE